MGWILNCFGYFSYIFSELKRSLYRVNKFKYLLGGLSFFSVICWFLFVLYFIWFSRVVLVYRWIVILKVLINRLSKIIFYLFFSLYLLLKIKINGYFRRRF